MHVTTAMRPDHLGSAGPTSTGPMTLPILLKSFSGALLILCTVLAWPSLGAPVATSQPQEDAPDYAVFYPLSAGDDREEFETGGGDDSAITIARDLYPDLEADGALFVDAANYRPDMPWDPTSPWPARPIRVNTNYLAQYPLLDEGGAPVRVEDTEQAWVVAVPEQYKPLDPAFEEYLQQLRTGDGRVEGAVQANERIVGEPAPPDLARQGVRILWLASGQDVVTLDSVDDSGGGRTVADPVVEIMTPANSLVVDRLNAITGEPDSPLKVPVDGDPDLVLDSLDPTLQRLGLDDNLQHLGTGTEAPVIQVGGVSVGVGAMLVIAVLALLATGLLDLALVATAADGTRRAALAHRLGRLGFARPRQQWRAVLGWTWLAQTFLAAAATAVLLLAFQGFGDLSGIVLTFAAVAVAVVVLEAIFVFAVAGNRRRRTDSLSNERAPRYQ